MIIMAALFALMHVVAVGSIYLIWSKKKKTIKRAS